MNHSHPSSIEQAVVGGEAPRNRRLGLGLALLVALYVSAVVMFIIAY
jgi:hypothetical protein